MGEWELSVGIIRKKKVPTETMLNVAMAKRRSKSEVLSRNAIDDMAEKKNALRPKAESGNAVAVPRWFGQLSAAKMRRGEEGFGRRCESYMS